jgi:hypothetical protein
MNQALYAHMNNKRKKINKIPTLGLDAEGVTPELLRLKLH